MAGRGTDRYRVSRYGTQRKLQAGWSRLRIQMKEEEHGEGRNCYG